MKRTFLLLLAAAVAITSLGQQKEEADKMIEEGIAYHDKGDYDGAITRYDKALELDKDNARALAEKATTLFHQQKYEDAIEVCKQAIKKHSGSKGLPLFYVVYGNALDALKKTDESVKIYDKGIKAFPDHAQLYYNKGVTLTSVQKYQESLDCFQAAATLSPQYPSYHNALAKVQQIQKNQVASLLAYWRFFALEPQSARAKANLPEMLKVLQGNVQQKDEKNINITLFMDPDKGKKKDNDFKSVEMILSLTVALDYSEEHKNETDIQKFIRKLETACSSLSVSKKEGKGFFWAYYAPYYIEMHDKKFLETFAYIVFASSDNPEIGQWLEAHNTEVEAFYKWSKEFSFKAD